MFSFFCRHTSEVFVGGALSDDQHMFFLERVLEFVNQGLMFTCFGV